MSNRIVLKIVGVVAIAILLFIPLTMIRGLIKERSRFREQAKADIAGSWTGAQTLIGPILRVPYTINPPEPDGTEIPGSRAPEPVRRECFVLPRELTIDAELRTEPRKRGLYSVPVYFTTLTMRGLFRTDELDALVGRSDRVELGDATLHVALSDSRGIASSPLVDWDGTPREIEPGSGLAVMRDGVQAQLGALGETGVERPFEITIELRGMESLSFLPMGEDTTIELAAGWPHPSFTGRFLPVEYEILDDSFRAEWRVSHLASRADDLLRSIAVGEGFPIVNHAFGVSLVNTVDVYQQTMRSAKYGSLFIILTFTAFFLIEFGRRLMLHPVQYLLVGLALSIFFLLLLSLSEHLAFGLAYLLASLACIGLVGIYLGTAMGRASNGAGVMGILGGLYGMLYAILLSEDNALLMGSLLLFSALAAVMLVTRRVDWYALDLSIPAGRGVAPGPAAGE